MSAIPSSSTHLISLRSTRWDLAQLLKVVKQVDDGSIPRQHEIPDKGDSLTHLHTLTLDITLQPPPEQLHAWRRDPAPNPEYAAYLELRDRICTHVDPLSPITLAPTQARLLRSPRAIDKEPSYRQLYDTDGRSVNVFLPSGHAAKPLAQLPSLPNDVAEEWMKNSKAWDLQHWLQAAISLDPETAPPARAQKFSDNKKRFHLQTKIQIVWLPGEDAGTDLKLLVTTDLLADIDALLSHPLSGLGADLAGLILYSIMPTAYPSPFLAESEARAAGLKRFFSGLKPAPDHPMTFNVKSLQPPQMQCQLLPFQNRTVGFLLRREGSPVVSDVIPTGREVRGLWEVVDLGGESSRMAYCRLTGALHPLEKVALVDRKGKGKASEEDEEGFNVLTRLELETLPQLLDFSSVKGTMLCEEMGLGKTVEAIALVLLHRHPLSTPRAYAEEEASQPTSSSKSRVPEVPVIDLLAGVPDMNSPVVKEWVLAEHEAFEGRTVYDELSQLNVTEVTATLIVTPPSLLKQWVSEIRRHAPYLRVCVYDGWKSLQKGIERQHAKQAKVHQRLIDGRKRKIAENFRRKTVNKYQRQNGGARVKVESDAEDYNEPEASLESSLELCQRRFVEYVRAHDIVITTYSDLAADLRVALPAPPRSRRSNADYRFGERPRSPLVMVKWWRVVMDEVQLHSDQSGASNMVSLIPRVHALAMSGTPAKSDVSDLMGSLKFLRVPILPQYQHIWHRLQQTPLQEAFEAVFDQIAVRTTKKEVAGEFDLPSQDRFVVPIQLSEIELHYYSDTLDRQRDLLHLPTDPTAKRPVDWRLDRALFRVCLRNLRQICTHIQVGQMQQQNIGRMPRLQLGKTLMTMSEALKKMRDDHSQELLVESRNQMRAMIRQGQFIVMDDTNPGRHLAALRLYQAARDKLNRQIGPVRQDLQRIVEERTAKELEVEEALTTPPRTLSQHEKERAQELSRARLSLREMLMVEHQTWFFEGDAHHVMNNKELEVESYARADAARKEILARPLEIANKSVDKLHKALEKSQAVRAVTELQTEETNMQGGLLTHNLANQANELLKILNGNAELLFAWRKKIIDLLSLPIDAEPETAPAEDQDTEIVNPEDELYWKGLQAQGEVDAFIQVYGSILADRKEFILEDRRNLLAEHDGRVKKKRATVAAQNALADTEIEPEGEVAEQTALLNAERQAFRLAREEKGCTRPLKGILFDLNPASLADQRPAERALAKMLSAKIKAYIDEQMEYHTNLAKELEMFRATFNIRVKYYSALQEVSDSVTLPRIGNLVNDIAECRAEVLRIEEKLARMTVKGRFLQFLSSKEGGAEHMREDCIICMGSSDDTHAVILECGHFYCRSCYQEMRRARTRHCPFCRADINDRTVTHFKLNGEKDREQEDTKLAVNADEVEDPTSKEQHEGSEGNRDPATLEAQRKRDLAKIKYLDIPRMREIGRLDMMGEYGSKIDFLIKHLLWYGVKEPDARHVIFSNWSDSLGIVMSALLVNNIKFVSFDQGGGRNRDAVEKFKNDPTIKVFLLHAERESSGLTLTSCRVVHLLEPVLQHSFELQAIGRVDRLGQDKKTTVFCYATEDTVETRILAQGVRNGTSIYLKDEAEDERVAEMPNVASAAHKGGDQSSDGNEEELLQLIM